MSIYLFFNKTVDLERATYKIFEMGLSLEVYGHKLGMSHVIVNPIYDLLSGTLELEVLSTTVRL
jgi:hypothetical protein